MIRKIAGGGGRDMTLISSDLNLELSQLHYELLWYASHIVTRCDDLSSLGLWFAFV
jgi:hypothetical protein